MNTPTLFFNQSSYKQQLESEEWLAFSRSMREAQPFCRFCRRGDVRLNVHHIFYDWTRKAWEYEPGEVAVLCEVCHSEMHNQLTAFRKFVFDKLTPQSFKILNGALSVAFEEYDPLLFSHALAEFIGNRRLVENHGRVWESQSAT